MKEFGLDWFRFFWFKLSTLRSFEWANPMFLYCLLLIPLILGLSLLIQLYNRQTLKVALPNTFLKIDPSAFLRYIPLVFLILSLFSFLLALARPQKSYEEVKKWTEGIDIMLAIDLSESMRTQDFLPNRLEAAKKVALDFIQTREENKIGAVIFSGDAIPYCPLTIDFGFLSSMIKRIDFSLTKQWHGTAIGNALAVSINRMKESKSKSKVIILMSDGDNNAGNIDPIWAAELANGTYNIKIYSIGIGKDGRQPFTDQNGRTAYIDNTLNEETLKKIAEIGQGQFFRATDNRTLEKIFNIIDEYEKTEIFEERFTHKEDFYTIYAFYGILFLLIWLLFKSTFMVNILQD